MLTPASITGGAPVLRPYQAGALDLLRDAYRQGARAPLFVLPTAGGKTVVFAAIAAAAVAKGRRVLVLAHRRELIRQASAKLAAAGVPHGVIAPGFPLTADPVQVASVQTLTRREVPPFGLVVVDEAHHAVSVTYRRILDALRAAKLLGVTATPERLDGKGLGIEAGGVFDRLVEGPSVAGLTKLGFLAPARCFAAPPPDLTGVRTVQGDYARDSLAMVMDVSHITGDAVEHYGRLAPREPAIVFCVSIAHADHVASAFRDAGWRAQSVSGNTPVRERDAALQGLGTGAVQVVTSCDLISEGLDVPTVGAVILLRPTQSLAMYLQQIGRGMRPAPGKVALIVLDHCGNIARHGLPDDRRVWSLKGRVRRPGSAPVKTCPECAAVVALGARDCPECGYVFPGRQEPPIAGDGVLIEIEREARRIRRIRELPLRHLLTGHETLDELREIARLRGYRRGWASYAFRDAQTRTASTMMTRGFK